MAGHTPTQRPTWPRRRRSPGPALLALGVLTVAAVAALPAPSGAVEACKGLQATITGTAGNDDIVGTQAADVIAALGGDDTVHGLDGNDVICLGEGNDVGWGAGGSNQFLPGTGNDEIHGNSQTQADLVVYEDAPGPVVVDLRTDAVSGASGVDEVEWIGSVVGSFHDDVIVGDAGNNTLSGNYGHDFLDGGDGGDHLRGGDGADQLFGGAGSDRLEGMNHHDQVEGGPGADALAGSFVNEGPSAEGDTVSYAGSAVGVRLDLTGGTATLADGHDIVHGITDVRGSEHDDRISANDAANVVEPGRGDDVVSTLGGNDTVHASPGDDDYHGSVGIDRVTFRDLSGPVTVALSAETATYRGYDLRVRGIENVDGTPFADVLVGNHDGNLVRGGAGDDAVTGGPGSDVVHGGGGNDLLRGVKGSDVLTGSAGGDRLVGGGGSDTCDGGRGTDTASTCEAVADVP